MNDCSVGSRIRTQSVVTSPWAAGTRDSPGWVPIAFYPWSVPDAGELVIVSNPDEGSSLGYLLRLPIGGGLVFRTAGTWPRTKALFCYPMPPDAWPEDGEVVERVPLRSWVRRGAAIEVVADRARENRSQLVFTEARGREMVFWQSPRTRKQARPNVALPTARAGGLADLEIIVDTRERYAYGFAGQAVSTVSRALPCGDYGVVADGRLVAAVERKSVPDLVSSVTNGKLRYALGDLAALPRAAVVIEDRYSALFKQRHARPSAIADALAEYQVRWPTIPIVFCETRPLAEEWTYRYLGRRLALGHHRARRPGTDHDQRPPPSERPGTAGADRRRSTRLGPERRARNSRPRPTPPRDLGRLALRPLTGRIRWPVVRDTGQAAGQQVALIAGISEWLRRAMKAESRHDRRTRGLGCVLLAEHHGLVPGERTGHCRHSPWAGK